MHYVLAISANDFESASVQILPALYEGEAETEVISIDTMTVHVYWQPHHPNTSVYEYWKQSIIDLVVNAQQIRTEAE